MRISKQRHSELYKSLYEPIDDLRDRNYAAPFDIDEMDFELLKLQEEIYERLVKALNIHNSK